MSFIYVRLRVRLKLFSLSMRCITLSGCLTLLERIRSSATVSKQVLEGLIRGHTKQTEKMLKKIRFEELRILRLNILHVRKKSDHNHEYRKP